MNSDRLITCRNVITGESAEVPADQLTFRPSAYGVVIKDDHLLLNGFHEGWLLPGGGVEKGETLEETLIREIQEETGLTVKMERLLNVEEGFTILSKVANPYFHTLKFHYLCTDPEGDITADGFDSAFEKKYMRIAEWVSLAKVGDLNIYNASNPQALIELALNAGRV